METPLYELWEMENGEYVEMVGLFDTQKEAEVWAVANNLSEFSVEEWEEI